MRGSGLVMPGDGRIAGNAAAAEAAAVADCTAVGLAGRPTMSSDANAMYVDLTRGPFRHNNGFVLSVSLGRRSFAVMVSLLLLAGPLLHSPTSISPPPPKEA